MASGYLRWGSGLKEGVINEIGPYVLNKWKWKGLGQCKEILKVPCVFQHFLSLEDTPSLAYAIPAFSAVINKWRALQKKYPHISDMIKPGIEKLEAYVDKIDDIPVYLLSMIINHIVKMHWINKHVPHRRQEILDILYSKMCAYSNNLSPELSQEECISKELSLGDDAPQESSSVEEELSSYLNAKHQSLLVKTACYNIGRYPTLFWVAIDVLPIQGTSVPCEWLLLSLQWTKTDLRTCLSNKLMEATQTLKNTIKKNGPLKFTHHLDLTEEAREIEDALEDEAKASPFKAGPTVTKTAMKGKGASKKVLANHNDNAEAEMSGIMEMDKEEVSAAQAPTTTAAASTSKKKTVSETYIKVLPLSQIL
ncbi:hypothetical protein VNI00_017149 [Paramarasmius palmivorus]|uniref:Uncharacterized protein n=1 Tax=Paramarasmius palmivorus TaxID=297713 RepID=A0AAW0B6V2_9AGAR